MANQNPEQKARDNIDAVLVRCGWVIQSIKQVNLNAGMGVAVKEYLTDVGPADYVLFVEGKPCGVIEAKREEEGHRMNVHEGQGNKFCKKITYKTDEDPKSVLSQFRNDYHPRIAVTVDMVATGTDIKPLECLLFMRDVKSINYFEQMKGRGTRTIDLDSLRKVTPTAKFTKDHFVIVDAIGVTKSLKTDSRPLEKKPGVPLKDLLQAVAVGAREEELFTSLANRLTRLDKQITEKEKKQFAEKANVKNVSQVVKELLNAFNPDVIDNLKLRITNEMLGAAPADIEREFVIRN